MTHHSRLIFLRLLWVPTRAERYWTVSSSPAATRHRARTTCTRHNHSPITANLSHHVECFGVDGVAGVTDAVVGHDGEYRVAALPHLNTLATAIFSA